MSSDFKNDFIAYLDDVLDDVRNVTGTDKEMRKQLIDISHDLLETIEHRLQIESVTS